MCSFFCCFVCCLFVVLRFWYTFVVSNVFLRFRRQSQIVDALRKLSLLIIHVENKICATTPRTTTTVVNINIVCIIHWYFYVVVIL